jgi:ribonuclease-3
VAEFDALQQRLGYSFRDASLLRLAFTHPSAAHEKGGPVFTNQRLEFLGDSVLGVVLTGGLYRRFADLDEGQLTKARARLVNRRTLAAHARALSFGPELILGHGEEKHGGRERISALADAYEAVVGAIFLDGGFASAQKFVLREFERELGGLAGVPLIENPKGELQERLQAAVAEAPQYELLSARGPDHDREFECVVRHQGRELARGRGKSKKAAESEAAQNALKILQEEKPEP